jgi:hypothetical protein
MHCGVGQFRGPDRVYRIEVPSRKRLTITATPTISTPQYDLAIYLKEGASCDALRCVAGDVVDGGLPTDTSTAIYDNGSAASRVVYVYVDSFHNSTSSFAAHEGTFSLTASLTDTPAGENCLTAPTLTPPQTVNDTSAGFVSNLYWSSQCSVLGAGRDRAYRVVIPPGERLTASVTPTTPGYDPNLALVVGTADACEVASISCAATDNSGTATATNTVAYTNGTTGAVEAFVVIDNGLVLDGGGAYTLSVALTSSGGETCATARTLQSGVTLFNQSTTGMTSDYGSRFSCAFGNGPDAVYALTLFAGQRVRVEATPAAGFDPRLNLLVGADPTACDGLCAALASSAGAGQTEFLGYTNRGVEPAAAYVIVDSTSGSGTYSIRADVDTPPPADSCHDPQPISGSGTFTGTTLGYTNDYPFGCGTPGLDRVYSLTLGAGRRLIARLTANTTGYAPRLHLYPGGDPAACDYPLNNCLATADQPDHAATRILEYSNRSDASGTYYLAIDALAANAGGDYTLEIQIDTAPPLPAGDRCDMAAPLTLGTPLSETLNSDYSDDHQDYCSLSGQLGRDKVYSLTVPAGERLRVTATPAAVFDVDIALMTVAGCATTDSAACLAKSQAAVTGQADTLYWNNRTGAAADVRLLVDSRSASVQPAYMLDAHLDTLPGDLCERAEPLPASAVVSGTLTGYLNDYQGGTSCGSTSGADRVYAIDVPASQWLTAILRPTGWDSALSLLAGPASNCNGTRTCLTSGDRAVSGALDFVRYRNTGATALQTLLVIENPSATSTQGPYELISTVEAANAGEDCAGAVPLSGSTRVAGSTEGYVNNYAPATSCTGFGTSGRDRVYSIEVPAGQRLTATVQPANTTFDPAIYLLAAPPTNCTATPTCILGDDSGAQDQINSVTYLNTTGAARTIYIVIDSASSTTTGPFLLTTTIGP